MVTIADFNSILQIAFGLNALFYAFDLVPQTENRIRELAEINDGLARKKIELTKNHEVFPIGFFVSATYPFHKRILSRLSLLISLIVLGFMFYDSFHPDAQLSTFLMWALLLPAFIIPWIAVRLHSRTVKMVEAANRILEKPHLNHDALMRDFRRVISKRNERPERN